MTEDLSGMAASRREGGGVPSIVVIASELPTREELAEAIGRRFGADYRIVSLSGLDVSRSAIAACGTIAIAIAPIGTSDFDALIYVGSLQPKARKVAVVRVGDTSVAQALSQALTLGHVDYYVGFPWASLEEELYPVISESLRIWAVEQHLQLRESHNHCGARANGRRRPVEAAVEQWCDEPTS